jgi:hypothetical protein
MAMADEAKDLSAQVGDTATRLIDTIGDTEKAALEAVRKFVDTVDGVFPDLTEDGPRRKIIDSAFRMTEQLVGASNQLATNVVKVTESALGDLERSGAGREA